MQYHSSCNWEFAGAPKYSVVPTFGIDRENSRKIHGKLTNFFFIRWLIITRWRYLWSLIFQEFKKIKKNNNKILLKINSFWRNVARKTKHWLELCVQRWTTTAHIVFCNRHRPWITEPLNTLCEHIDVLSNPNYPLDWLHCRWSASIGKRFASIRALCYTIRLVRLFHSSIVDSTVHFKTKTTHISLSLILFGWCSTVRCLNRLADGVCVFRCLCALRWCFGARDASWAVLQWERWCDI